jgi:hypothetical protein
VGIRFADHATPSTRKDWHYICMYKGWAIKTSFCTATFNDILCLRLVLTSPTNGGRSISIVRLRTTVTEFIIFIFYFMYNIYTKNQKLSVVFPHHTVTIFTFFGDWESCHEEVGSCSMMITPACT